jgi:hypothetical protein
MCPVNVLRMDLPAFPRLAGLIVADFRACLAALMK